MQQPNRNYTSSNYRYGFQGQEKDDELKGEGNSINYKYRMHDPRVGRFFAVDPLSLSFPWNSTYSFSENKVINGVELEGSEWKLVIYSPALSKRFIEAQRAGDIYEMRAITHYARTHHFKSDYGLSSIGLNKESAAAQLYYNEEYFNGVEVLINKFKENSSDIISDGSFFFHSNSNPDIPEDATYPVDVKFGSGYYGDKDFIGLATSNVEGSGVVSASITYGSGYLKGFGFFEYVTTGTGGGPNAGISFDVDLSENSGKFISAWGTDNIPTIDNFSGKGFTTGLDVDFGVSIGYSKWYSESREWSGGYYKIGGGVSIGIGTAEDTFTTTTFPSSKYKIKDGKYPKKSDWGENKVDFEKSEKKLIIKE